MDYFVYLRQKTATVSEVFFDCLNIYGNDELGSASI
jgi:hypothetical protein